LNIGLRRDILVNKATVSFNVSDIFNTRNFRITTEDARFTQTRKFQRETRIATLSLTYRFGRFKDKEQDQSRREGGVDFSGDDF